MLGICKYGGRMLGMSQKTKHRGGDRRVRSKSVQKSKTIMAALLLFFVCAMVMFGIFALVR